MEYFGLWLSADYGQGHSKAKPKCSTYNSPRLSKEEDFNVQLLEVWGVGDPVLPDEVSQFLCILQTLYSPSFTYQCFNHFYNLCTAQCYCCSQANILSINFQAHIIILNTRNYDLNLNVALTLFRLTVVPVF